LDALIDALRSERGSEGPVFSDDPWTELRSLMNVRQPSEVPPDVLAIQDEYLSEEIGSRGIVDWEDIPTLADSGSKSRHAGKISLWQGDMTALRIGAVVNAANPGMRGCFAPMHLCIDNCIHTYAGMQLRLECDRQVRAMEEFMGATEWPVSIPMMTPAYNLPSEYVIHVAGPVVEGEPEQHHADTLAQCYMNVLDMCSSRRIRTVAFCCISTGEYGYPAREAAEIAVKSVKGWLDSRGERIDRVVFDVFLDRDREIYADILSRLRRGHAIFRIPKRCTGRSGQIQGFLIMRACTWSLIVGRTNPIMDKSSVELVTIENVSKSFDGKCVLNNVSAKLTSGKIIGLIGKSAAGKSVLIHMVRGNEEYAPDSGRIIYHVNRCCKCGRLGLPIKGEKCSECGGETETLDVDYWSLKSDDPLRLAVRARIAIMLQRTFALFGDMTVVENVMEAIPADVQGDKRINLAIKMLELVNMTHRTTHIARDLSGGEKQRVVMARQLAKSPLFFLADEPTGTLDPTTAEIVHEGLVNYVRDHGICMMFASHWPEAITRMADEAMLMDAGNVKMQGEPKKVADEFMKDYHFEKSKTAGDIGEPLIVLENAEKHYFSVVRGVVKAVDGVSFDIKEREVFAMVGYSGAGKTTTSRMIAGMTPATGGSVKIRIGDDWIDMSESGFAGKGRATPYIGFLHQEYTLYPFDTVLQNLSTCIGMKMPAELAKVKAIQVLISVGFPKQDIEKILYSYPDSLSVGECQRIAFAQVLIKEPRIIILDEPTGTMDPITKTIVAKSVIRARETLGETFIVVSHDMDFVLNCSDRAVFMKGGKVVTMGSPEEVLEQFGMEPVPEGE